MKLLAASLGQVFPVTWRDIRDLGLEVNLYPLTECKTYIVLVCECVYVHAFECVCFGLFFVCVCVSQCVGERVCATIYMYVHPCACVHVCVHTLFCVYMCTCVCGWLHV